MKTEEIVDAARNAGFSSSEIMHRLAEFKRLIQYSTSAERKKCTGTQEFVTLPCEVVEQALEALINEGEFRKLMKPLIEKSIDTLRAALQQPNASITASVPAGWKLVPVEPTEKMIDIGRSLSSFPDGVYRAMLAAAPQPPTTEQSSVVQQPKGEQEPDAWLHSEGKAQPLYLHQQPKREPLDGEEILRLWDEVDGWFNFARAIEAAHNIK